MAQDAITCSILGEISTTKSSWKNLHIEGIKLYPPPSYMRLNIPPLQLLELFPWYFQDLTTSSTLSATCLAIV